MSTWKTKVLRSVTFGVAFGLALNMIVGLFVWYTSRPNPKTSKLRMDGLLTIKTKCAPSPKSSSLR